MKWYNSGIIQIFKVFDKLRGDRLNEANNLREGFTSLPVGDKNQVISCYEIMLLLCAAWFNRNCIILCPSFPTQTLHFQNVNYRLFYRIAIGGKFFLNLFCMVHLVIHWVKTKPAQNLPELIMSIPQAKLPTFNWNWKYRKIYKSQLLQTYSFNSKNLDWWLKYKKFHFNELALRLFETMQIISYDWRSRVEKYLMK